MRLAALAAGFAHVRFAPCGRAQPTVCIRFAFTQPRRAKRCVQGLAQAQRAPSQPAGAARIQAQSLLDVIKQAQLIDTRKHLL